MNFLIFFLICLLLYEVWSTADLTTPYRLFSFLICSIVMVESYGINFYQFLTKIIQKKKKKKQNKIEQEKYWSVKISTSSYFLFGQHYYYYCCYYYYHY